MTHATHFEREIREQPETLTRLLDEGRDAATRVAERIRAYGPRVAFIAARGTSDNAARYAQYLFGARNALAVGLTTPSLFTLYERPPRLADNLVIGVSQSGQSPDIVAVIAEARRQGALTVALTNDAASPLATAAELRLPLRAGQERAVAATKTYTTQLLALAMLSLALDGDEDDAAALGRLPEAVGRTLERNARLPEQAGDPHPRRFVVIGRGFNYATAFEIALKLKETSYVVAEPFSSADFRHGPAALIEPGFPVVLVAPSGRVFRDVADLMGLLRERAARVVAITDQPAAFDGTSILPLADDVPEWLSPIVAVVPGQLLALGQAQARGFDPDHPRGLRKVTQTR